MKESTRRYCIVFLVALSSRIVVWLFIIPHPWTAFDNDSPLYVSLGSNLFRYHVFSSLLRTPVYPFFIAASYYIFGEVLHGVLFLQCVLDSLSAVAASSIFYKLFKDSRYSLTAGLIYALNPFAVYYSNRILTETLFTFLLVITIYFLVMFLDGRRYIHLAIAGSMLGLSLLCRPISLYLPLLILPGLFFVKGQLKKKVIACILFVLCFSAVVTPWYLRNYKYYHRWTLSPIDELNYFISFAPEVLMVADNPLSVLQIRINEPIEHHGKLLWNQVRSRYGWRETGPFAVIEDAERATLLREEGEMVILQKPLIFLTSHLLNISRTLCPYYPRFSQLTLTHAGIFQVLSFVIDLVTIVCFIAGTFFSVKGRLFADQNRIMIYIMIAMIFYFSFIPGIIGYPRFRVPVLPYISILSAVGIKGVFQRMRFRTGRTIGSGNQSF